MRVSSSTSRQGRAGLIFGFLVLGYLGLGLFRL